VELADPRVALRVQRIVAPVVVAIAFAADQQLHRVRGVVDEGVRDAGAGRKADRVAGREPVEHAVDPGVGRTLDDEDEFVLAALAVGP
jgi:hypothetical protein